MTTSLCKLQHDMELPAGAGGAPEWVHLLPLGTFYGRDGRGPWRVDNPAAVIAATRRHFGAADIPLDYEHQTELAPRNGKPAPAAGWIREMEARTDGLWARVEWTEAGARAVSAREYRYLSPVFLHDKSGQVSRFNSAALTNIPNLELKALSSALHGADESAQIDTEECSMTFKKEMARSLGLSADAGEEELLAAAQAAMTGKPDPAQYVPMSMHRAVSEELSALKAEQARAESAALVKAAQASGQISPAMLEWAEYYAASDPEGFKAWMRTAPDMRPGGGLPSSTSAAPPLAPSGSVLTANQKAVCAAMGCDEVAYQKTLVSLQVD